jgi:hypothetical protein
MPEMPVRACVDQVSVTTFGYYRELGLVVITQILTTPGVELVGPIPPEIRFYTDFVAGVSANSKAPDAALPHGPPVPSPVAVDLPGASSHAQRMTGKDVFSVGAEV